MNIKITDKRASRKNLLHGITYISCVPVVKKNPSLQCVGHLVKLGAMRHKNVNLNHPNLVKE